MKFVLDLWPDEPQTPAQLLAFAVQSVRSNDELVWDIFDDHGNVLHSYVSLNPLAHSDCVEWDNPLANCGGRVWESGGVIKCENHWNKEN